MPDSPARSPNPPGLSPAESVRRLRANIAAVYFGAPAVIDRVIICVLARGHLLIEDVPGVGKTVLATALARSIDCSFSRIQLTPDLLPSDILGTTVLDRDTSDFVFRPGPIFANVVLADEVNRTPPRTQSALLEAMSEATVSIDGKVTPLDQPFMVVATQNPHDFEGTYPLPENQLDRFLMRTAIGYPSNEDEARVIDRRPAAETLRTLRPVLHKDDVIRLQSAADAVRLDPSLIDYIVRFATATRRSELLSLGLSPRGSLALAQAARAAALVSGRAYVTPDDIVDLISPVCGHRVVTKSRHATTDIVATALDSILETVPSPA